MTARPRPCIGLYHGNGLDIPLAAWLRAKVGMHSIVALEKQLLDMIGDLVQSG
jgi:hypothetical protein